ncbi:PAS domain S-box protein [bacterium]|nr:PAS domain S-box protein [bacterium]
MRKNKIHDIDTTIGHHDRLSKNLNQLIAEIKNLHKRVRILEEIRTELRKSEEGLLWLAAVVRDSNDAVTVLDFKGNILFWNRGAERIYGWSEEEALYMNILNMMPKDRQKDTMELLKRLKRGEPIESFESQRLTKKREIRDLWVTITLLKEKQNLPFAIATTERDITEEKREKEGLRRLKEQCDLKIERKGRELSAAREKVDRTERLASLGKQAGIISHELKDPLNAINLNLYLLQDRIESITQDKRIKMALDAIQEAVDESVRIIENVLSFSKGKEPRMSKNSMEYLIDKTMERVKVPPSIEVIKDIHKELSEIYGDETQLILAFSNIIKNAVQAMPDGGRIIITLREKRDMAEIRFTDTGPGITPEKLEKIFDPLFSTKAKGTGLGLSVCKEIITAHNWNLEVESTVGKGTHFIVTLPLP